MKYLLATKILLLSWIILCPISAAQQGIIYLPFDESFSRQIIVQTAKGKVYEAEKIYSPNHLASVQSINPNFAESDPWSSTLFVQHARYETLQLDFIHHANSQVTSTWINDELLHIKVWWGRVLGSDLILDVSTAKFIYKCMFVYTLYSSSQEEASKPPLVNLEFKLEPLEGTIQPDFKRFEVLSLKNEVDSVSQFRITTRPPMISTCYLEASSAEIQAFESFIQQFIAEQSENMPPRPLETVCRNCTIYEMTWVYQGISGRFVFSEQRPFRYPALDSLFPLLEAGLKRMSAEAECDA